jgi:hypothetical protein
MSKDRWRPEGLRYESHGDCRICERGTLDSGGQHQMGAVLEPASSERRLEAKLVWVR